ncbi:MAG TPA: S8 family serine peptidase [Pirellulaceae bacterium]|nr:S8 family serine peptidase [Pirellulaceae bacterium]
MKLRTSARSRHQRRSLFVEPLEKRLLLDAVGVDVSNAHNNLERVIVMFHDQVEHSRAAAETLVESHGGQLGGVYETIFKGFAGRFPSNRLDALRGDSSVKLVEPDLLLQPFGQVIPTGVARIGTELNNTANINGSDERVQVVVGVLDTGVQGDHPDLNVNNISSADCTKRGGCEVGAASDTNGHGTHVAGTIGALDNDIGVVGVAPGAEIWSIKVCGNSGCQLSAILAGHQYVSNNAGSIDVINLSLGGTGWSESWRTAIKDNVAKGVVVVVAAGNSSRDIYGGDGILGNGNETIPAAFPEAAAISALADSDGIAGGAGPETSYGLDDTLATFSNFSTSVVADNPVMSPGAAIDWAAPGVDILSTYKGSGYHTISGTSMASPHGAGAVALYIAENGRATNAAGVAAIRQALINGAQPMVDWGGNNTDPDSNNEGMVYLGQAQLAHDVAVTAVSASPATVTQGDMVTVTVDLANHGTNEETFQLNVTESPNGIPIAFENVTLLAGDTIQRTYTWTTSTETTAGTHTITATATLAGDENATNNSASTSLEVNLLLAHDVAVTAVSASPSTVTQGDAVTVTVDLANHGTNEATFQLDVTESPNGVVVVASETVTLLAGDTIQRTYTWTTSIDTTAGTHTITATVTLAEDENTTNNSKETTVTVEAPSSEATKAIVQSITYTTEGGKNSDRHLNDTVAVVDDLGSPVSGASVSIQLDNTTNGQPWTASGTTGTDGKVTFNLKNAPDGCYVTTMTAVAAGGLTWNGVTPDNSFCKGGTSQAGRALFSVATRDDANDESRLADQRAQSIHEGLSLPLEASNMIGRSVARPSLNQSVTAAVSGSPEDADGGDLRLLLLVEDRQRHDLPEISNGSATRNRLDLGPILEQLADELMLGDLDAALLDELGSLA